MPRQAGKPIRRQCTAHRKNGDQCRAGAILGATVCRVHGGAAPQVRRKAQERIDAAAYKLVGILVDMAEDGGVEPKDRINAIKELLNRSAEVRQATSRVEHSGSVGPDPAYLALVEQAKAQLRAMGDEPFKGKVFSIEDAIDAEVVDDD